jgi:hypothetical protein
MMRRTLISKTGVAVAPVARPDQGILSGYFNPPFRGGMGLRKPL